MSTSAKVSTEPPHVESKPRRLWLHGVLFLATLLTTALVGLEMSLSRQAAGDSPPGPGPIFWFDGLSYAFSIMAILLAHEMGHYLEARRRGVDASLPYFIPMISAFGTLGAFIRLRPERQIPADTLVRIGAYGPLAGFVVTLPVLFVGMWLSDVGPAPEILESGIRLGDSLLLMAAEAVFFGDVGEGVDVWLHPMAFAGWAGLFVTALNLLPLSQLDGGHIAYCLFGERSNRVAPFLFVGLVLLTVAVFPGWLMLCILLAVIGVGHPPMCPDTPVRGRGRWIGWLALGLLLLCFSPRPFGGIPTFLELMTR